MSMIQEIIRGDASRRDRKVGWTGRRHFFVTAGNAASARSMIDRSFPRGSVHPACRLMQLQRIEPLGRSDDGRWMFDAVYWLPIARDRAPELQAVGVH
ncbi:MAG: hypothetical protein M0Z50_04700 [Planctomycetia bacterium]|nr:hypothetical protein [Planctomycetia bacterium]